MANGFWPIFIRPFIKFVLSRCGFLVFLINGFVCFNIASGISKKGKKEDFYMSNKLYFLQII